MMSLLKELLGYASDSTIIIYASLAAILLTIIIHLLFRKYSRFLKYIPGTIMLIIGIFSLYKVLDSLVEAESLDELMNFISFVVSGLVGIFSALILGVYDKPRKKRRKKKKIEEKEQKA